MCKDILFAEIKAFLAKEGIEYCSAIEFSRCRVTNKRRMPDFDVKSVVVFLIPYKTGTYPDRNVSLYSVSRDYHLYAEMLSKRLGDAFSDCPSKLYLTADSSPLNEREAAIEAGLGVIGQNRLVINEKYGSYVFIGTILTDATFGVGEYAPVKMKNSTCVSCGKCKRACDFLDGKRSICLSDLTQKKRVTQEELSVIRSNRVRWGCDTCQEVCPMNKDAQNTPISFFYEAVIPKVSGIVIENMTDEEFKSRAYSWRGKNIILRNLMDE